MEEASVFAPVGNDEVFDRVEPLDSQGGTSRAYLVCVNGQQFFMKQLKAEYVSNPRYRVMFMKEFCKGHEINHPHIVGYKETGENADGPYILMEYVTGDTLSKKLKNEPEYFRKREHLDKLFTQLLQGLKCLHSHHIIYCDLKPENIMITRINHDVKIIDLGFCETDDYVFTAGMTKSFAAPEQQQTIREELDVRTDIYAIGKLIEYIASKTGSKLPHPYPRIMTRCLRQQKEHRYPSVDKILQIIDQKRHMHRTIWISLTILLLLLVPTYLVIRRTNGYLEFKELIEWTLTPKKYDVELFRVLYRITSETHRTCGVVGGEWHANAMIEPKITIEGKVYQVTEVLDGAYMRGRHLESVYLPEGIERIGENAFSECSGISTLDMPTTLNELRNRAFYHCDNLRSIKFSPNLKEIPNACFAYAIQIQAIHLPEGLETIRLDAFAYCERLKRAILPSTLKTIERGVFYECKSLQQIVIPAGVTKIGEFTFFGCTSLTDVYIHTPEPPVVSRIFKDQEQLTIHVPAASVNKYRQAAHWSDFTIQAMEDF